MISTPFGDHSLIFENISFDLISPAEAPKLRQKSIFSWVHALTKLSQPKAWANCIPAVPIPLAPA